MPSRKIEDLNPDVQPVIRHFEECLKEEGLINFKRCCTYRSQVEQDCVYMQGREELYKVNAARLNAGLYPIKAGENKRPVTWTHTSKHTSRDAVDYYVEKNGQYINDTKVDYDDDDIPDWDEFGKIAEECGLEWGGSWEKQDIPHVQMIR
jgi:peptidoglycan L-alanyl-D-glutamate endopeptidase CwlK